MKKLLFILILFITSCTYTKVNDSTSVPNVITEQLKSTQADTVYVLRSNNFHYYYNSDKVLIERYTVTKNDFSIDGIFVIIFLISFVILVIGINNLSK